MITGHNTDINYNGIIYHVQTEDKGHANPVIETLVYKGGEILEARRTTYAELLKDGYDEKRIIAMIVLTCFQTTAGASMVSSLLIISSQLLIISSTCT